MSAEQQPAQQSSPLKHRRERLLAMAGVAATVTLVAFDATIVANMLPRAAQALNGMDLYAWVGTAYLLSTAASIMVFGRLGDLYGRRTLMLLSVALVALGSVLSGLSLSMPQLILWRALQGIGGGMMIATAFAAPADLFPDPRERVRWLALVSVAFAIASGIGPVLGGAITQALGWRAAFFVTPTAAILALTLLARYFPRLSRPQRPSLRQQDWIGAILMVIGIAAPLAALELGLSSSAHANPPLALGLLAAGLLAIACFIPHERRSDSPIFPLRVLRPRNAQLLNLAAMQIGAIMFILVFYSPLLLQHVLHHTPSTAGLLMTPLVLGIPIASLINGRLYPRQSQPQRLMVLGSLLLALGCFLVLRIQAGTSTAWTVTAFSICGLGLGFLLPNLTLFMQMISEPRDVGTASALVQTTRAIGSAVGTAAIGVLIARMSVLSGIHAGLVASIGMSLACAFISHRIQMRNVMPAGSRHGGNKPGKR